MKKTLILICLSFIAYVRVPLMSERKYEVKEFDMFATAQIYILTLMDGRKIHVPTFFTIIEEKSK